MPNSFIVKRSREFRHKMTLAEKILWQFLRGSCFAGLRFRRQHPVGYYIVDFCCPKKKLIIELDGKCHEKTEREDKDRDGVLKKHGFRVLRFTNDHVFDHIDWILQTIASELAIDWHKNYYDCIDDVKFPQRLYALLAKIKNYREKITTESEMQARKPPLFPAPS